MIMTVNQAKKVKELWVLFSKLYFILQNICKWKVDVSNTVTWLGNEAMLGNDLTNKFNSFSEIFPA